MRRYFDVTKTDIGFSLTLLLIGLFILYLFLRDDEYWFLLTLISVTVAVIYVCYRCNSHWRNVHRGLESSASRDGSRDTTDPPGRRHNGRDEDESCHDKSEAKIPMTAEDKRRALVRGRLEVRKIATKPTIHTTTNNSNTSNKSEESTTINSETTTSDCTESEDGYCGIDDGALQQLMEMGFGANASRKALEAVGGSDIEAAMDWILEHKGNFILDHNQRAASPSPSSSQSLSRRKKTDGNRGEVAKKQQTQPYPKINQVALDKLIKMGLRVNACKKALSAVGGSDTVAAMHWMFEHVTDPDFDDPFPEPYDETEGDDSTNKDSNNDNNNSCLCFSMDSLHGRRGSESSINGTSRKEAVCCAICLESYAIGDTVARLKTPKPSQQRSSSTSRPNNTCNHWYHEDCILGWLQNHDSCPMCRVDMINDTHD